MKRWLLILSAMLVVVLLGFIVGFPALKRHIESVNCSNQMHAILFVASFSWPLDNQGHLPSNFLALSNELGTPKVLVCPSDHSREAATNWAVFATSNCSYEVVTANLLRSNTNGIFMRCPKHEYIGCADDRLLDRSGHLIRPNRLW